jgi:hypothetical protein
MPQFDFGNLESPLSGAEFINSNMEPWRDALHSSHKGAARPSYVAAGMIWVDDSGAPLWVAKLFDGSQDITIGTFNITSHAFTPSANAALAANSVDTANIVAQAVANTKLAAMAANTVKTNNTSGSASPSDLSMGTSTILARLSGNIVAASITQILDLIAGTPAQGDVLFRGVSTYQRLPAGTAGQTLQSQGASADPVWAGGSQQSISVGYEVVSGTAAITATTVAWTTVPMNTTDFNNIAGASHSAGVVTLPAGTYKVNGYASFANQSGFSGSNFELRLRDTTNGVSRAGGGAVTVLGLNSGANIPINGIFTLSGTANIELQYYANATGAPKLGSYASGSGSENMAWNRLTFDKIG